MRLKNITLENYNYITLFRVKSNNFGTGVIMKKKYCHHMPYDVPIHQDVSDSDVTTRQE
jgi:hypothetical protein